MRIFTNFHSLSRRVSFESLFRERSDRVTHVTHMPSNLVSGDLDVKSESDVVDDGDENYQGVYLLLSLCCAVL